jgi:hypothetical protein
MWGARGPFLLEAAMVFVVVTPVVFVLRLLKNAIKTLKSVVCKQYLYLFLYIVKHIAIHVPLIVAWPEPKPHWSNRTPACWVLPESSKRHKSSWVIINWPQHRNELNSERSLLASYLRLLITLDFFLF